MAKYKTKPEYVEAFQYDGDLKDSDGNYYVPDWAVRAFEYGRLYYLRGNLYLADPDNGSFIIEVGDYIIYRNEFPFYSLDVYEESDFKNSFEFVSE